MKTSILMALLLIWGLPSCEDVQDSGVLAESPGLRVSMNRFVAKLGTDGVARIANSQAELPESQRVMLRTREGYYLRAKLGGGNDVVADVKHPKSSEVFTIEWLTLETVRFRTREGYYVGARLGGGANVDATVEDPKSSEVFTVEWYDDTKTKLRLRTRDGFYVHAVSGGGGNVDARIRSPKTSEVFELMTAL